MSKKRRAATRLVSWPALILLLLPTLYLTGCTAYVPETDIVQERLDVATPPLDGTHTVVQSFICQHPNLYEIELLPAVYQTPGQGTLNLYLCSSAPGRQELVRQSIDVSRLSHNAPLRFTFVPQRDSAGEGYELRIEGEPGVRVGFWYNSVNAYGEGELALDGQSAGGDLRFITHCRCDLTAMADETGELLRRIAGDSRTGAWLVISLAMLFLVPGPALWYGLGLAKRNEPVVNLAVSVAISLAVVPVCLLWSTKFGLRWGRSLCLVAYLALVLYVLARLLRTRFRDLSLWMGVDNRTAIAAVVLVLALTLLLRLVQIRGLVLPAWVDSPQHTLVTELIIRHGQVPPSYEPLLPAKYFVYHFGFHADMAVLHWLSGVAIPQAMLILGQVLNAASGLMAYLLTLRLTGRRLAAVVATLVVGFISYMPAYYVSWGRYSQLTGLLLMPAALVTAIDWLSMEPRDYRLFVVAGLMHAGLFLTHARITILSVCFLVVYLLYESLARWRRGDERANLELWGRAGLLTLLALALCGSWLAQVITGIQAALRATGRNLRGDPSYNAFPYALLLVARNRELMALAAIGAVWGLLRRRKETLWVLAWCALVMLVINPGWLGVPTTNLVNNATAVIALFVPLAVLDGQAVAFLWDYSPPLFSRLFAPVGLQRYAGAAIRAILAIGIIAAALWGAWGTISIVNPATVLATAEDLAAMNWIQEKTPEDAVFLINTRHWQLGIFVGTDGGYWIPRLTGRRTLLPELPYVHGTADDVQRIGNMAQTISQLKDASDPKLQDILEQGKVTHVYLGTKGGPLTPQMFLRNSHYRPVYSTGAVWIFEVTRSVR